MRKIQSVKNAMEEAIVKSKKLKESILKARWTEVVGELAKKSTPLYLKEGVLYSLVEGPAFLQHMNMNKNKYIEKANKLLNGNYITDFRFKVGTIPIEEYFHEVETEAPDEPVVELTPWEKEGIRESCMEIEDIDLRDKIIHLKEESLKREKYLEKKGYKKCLECGALYDRSEGDICRVCENKVGKSREEKVFKIFSKNPYAGYEEIQDSIKEVTRDDFKRYKQKKLDNIYRRAYFLVKVGKKEEAIQCLYNYFRLETGNKNEYEIDSKSRNLVELIKEKIAGR